MKSVDAGSSDVSGSLILNSEESVNGNSGSNLTRTDVSSSASALPVIVR